ncbi:mucin-7-like [Anomalospiza imberbis]|uniref:mucin-7-like n=1 Tax=Anomalospiza imberbis TaxID=187417 RepID=UPI0035902751
MGNRGIPPPPTLPALAGSAELPNPSAPLPDAASANPAPWVTQCATRCSHCPPASCTGVIASVSVGSAPPCSNTAAQPAVFPAASPPTPAAVPLPPAAVPLTPAAGLPTPATTPASLPACLSPSESLCTRRGARGSSSPNPTASSPPPLRCLHSQALHPPTHPQCPPIGTSETPHGGTPLLHTPQPCAGCATRGAAITPLLLPPSS